MPPACPVDRYVPCYTDGRPVRQENATGLPGGSLRSLLHRRGPVRQENATGLPGGSLRSLLHRRSPGSPRKCHRLARWIVTFLATQTGARFAKKMPPACPVDRYVPCYTDGRPVRQENATGLPGGSLRSLLHRRAPGSPRKCHRLARWIVTFLATQTGARFAKKMPPACPVDRYVPCYTDGRPVRQENATGLPGGSLRSLLHRRAPGSPRKCHRLARWIVTFLATGS